GMYIPAMPVLMREFTVDAGTVQFGLTSNLAGMAIGQFLAGPLSDRVGRRRPLLVSLGISAVASLGCAVVNQLEVFILLRFIQGAAGAMGMVLASVIVTDMFTGGTLLRMFSILAMIGTLGPIVAPVLGTWWLQSQQWQGMFVVCAVVAALTVVLAAWLLPATL